MDQVRDVLKFLQKHGFWISCGLIALVVLGLWFQATGTIQADTKKFQGDWNNDLNTLRGIKKDASKHPNIHTAKAMDETLKLYGIDVAQGWDSVYNRQKKVLVWPESLVGASSMGKKFERRVNDLRPIEIVPFPTPRESEIEVGMRQYYRDWIRLEIPKLAKRIGAEWAADANAEAAVAPRPPMIRPGVGVQDNLPGPPPPLVDWSATNQQEIMTQHFAFTELNEIPSTLDVLYAQETIWVLDSLMGIIKDVNGAAELRYQTAVHSIESIQLGKSAGGVGGQVTPVVDPNAVANAFPSGPTPPAGFGPTAGPGPGPGSPTGPAGEQAQTGPTDPAEGRYVDQAYEPLTAARLRAALAPNPTAAADVVLAVAKRMPVRLRLKLDQRKTNLFLAACGNSPLPLEVRQVRINREPSTGTTAGGPGFAMPMAGPGPGPGPRPPGLSEGPRGGLPPMQPRPSAPPGVAGQQAQPADPNEITLEVFGIVYIFNPVNTKMLGITPEEMKAGVAPIAGPAGAPGPAAPVASPAAAPAVPAVPVGPQAGNPNATPPLAAAGA